MNPTLAQIRNRGKPFASMLPWLPARAIPQLIANVASMPISGLIMDEIPDLSVCVGDLLVVIRVFTLYA